MSNVAQRAKNALKTVKKVNFIRQVISLIIYALYITYKIAVVNEEYKNIDTVLLISAFAYLVFLIISYVKEFKGTAKRIGGMAYKTIKFLMLAITAFIALESVFTLKAEVNFFTLAFAVITPFNLLLQIGLDILIFLISRQVKFWSDRIKREYETVKAPVDRIKAALKKKKDAYGDLKEVEENEEQ